MKPFGKNITNLLKNIQYFCTSEVTGPLPVYFMPITENKFFNIHILIRYIKLEELLNLRYRLESREMLR